MRPGTLQQRGSLEPLTFLHQQMALLKIEQRRAAPLLQLGQHLLGLLHIVSLEQHTQEIVEQLFVERIRHHLQSPAQTGNCLGAPTRLLFHGGQGHIQGSVLGVEFHATLQMSARFLKVPLSPGQSSASEQHLGVVRCQLPCLGQGLAGLLQCPESLLIACQGQVGFRHPLVGRDQVLHDLVGSFRVLQRAAQQLGQARVTVHLTWSMLDRPGEPRLGLRGIPGSLLALPQQILQLTPSLCGLISGCAGLQQDRQVISGAGPLAQVHRQGDPAAAEVGAVG